MAKFLLLYDANFPFEGECPNADFFNSLADSITIVNVNQLSVELDSNQYSCLIQLHGAYFPKNSWSSIVRFLKNGNGLLQTKAGYYRIRCEAASNSGETRLFHQGFWGYDAALLEKGDYLSCDKDYFRKNNRPLPIRSG